MHIYQHMKQYALFRVVENNSNSFLL